MTALLVVNAGNREAAYGWLKDREIRGSEVCDASDEYALLAVQGPNAREKVLGLLRESDRTSVAEAAKKHKVSKLTIYVWRKRPDTRV